MGRTTPEVIKVSEPIRLEISETIETPTGFGLSFCKPSDQLGNVLGQEDFSMGELFSGELAVKHEGWSNGTFCTKGDKAQDALLEEGSVMFRQRKVGVAPGFSALALMQYGDSEHSVKSIEIVEGNADNSQAVIVMPKLDKESRIERLYELGKIKAESAEERKFAERLVKRLFSMKEGVGDGIARYYGTLDFPQMWPFSLVVDKRMRDFIDDSNYGNAAGCVAGKLEDLFRERWIGDFLRREVKAGRVADHNGDCRFDNIFSLDTEDELEPMIIDPVRLRMKDGVGYRPKYEWWNTHDYYQLGLLLGKAYAFAEFHGLFRSAISAYTDMVANDEIVTSKAHRKFMGIGLVYGMSVENNVLNDRNEHGMMRPYWDGMVQIADTNFEGWVDIL